MRSISGDNWTVYHGDARAAMALMPERSVHCVVTSPPYWGGIRDYQISPSVWGGDSACEHEWIDASKIDTRKNDSTAGPKQRSCPGSVGHRVKKVASVCSLCGAWLGCYGNELRVEEYVAHTLEIFGGLRRILRDDGVIFWNIGDTYADSTKWGGKTGGKYVKELHGQSIGRLRRDSGLLPGNKSLVPFRVAIALQEAGWIVRQDVVWFKPAPMPESIDGVRWARCRVKVASQKAPKQLSSLASTSRGPSRDKVSNGEWIGGPQYVPCDGCPKCESNDGYVLRRGAWRPTTSHEFVLMVTKADRYFCDAAVAQEPVTGGAHSRVNGVHPKSHDADQRHEKQNGNFSAMIADTVESRNPRSVWRISSESYKGKHFAAYPTMLAWKCIQAATSKAGCCSACGAQYAPIIEKVRVPTRPGIDTKVGEYMVLDKDSPYQDHAGTICGNRDPQRHIAVKRTLGYRPTCGCQAESVPAIVFDPFTGSGTTLQVSVNTGRRFVGCEIAEHYLPLIQERAATPWAPKVHGKAKKVVKAVGEADEYALPLFGGAKREAIQEDDE